MCMFGKLKEAIENKAFRKFFIRATLFSYILIAEVVLLGLLINFRGAKLGIKTVFSDFPVNFLVFFILFFLVMSHRGLFKVKPLENLTRKKFIPFFTLNLISVFSFYGFTQYLINNPATGAYSLIFTVVWWLLGLAILVFLALSFFDISYIGYLAKNKHLVVSGILALLFAFLVPWNWFKPVSPSFATLMAEVVGRIVTFLLSIFMDGVSYVPDAKSLPTLIVPGFTAKIGMSCSGLSGMVLFAVLFSIFALIEYKRLDVVKVLIALPIGVVFMFLANILRIFAIFMAGHYVNPTFAMGIFHRNVGWVLFTAYFLAFIYITYPWMRQSRKKKK